MLQLVIGLRLDSSDKILIDMLLLSQIIICGWLKKDKIKIDKDDYFFDDDDDVLSRVDERAHTCKFSDVEL